MKRKILTTIFITAMASIAIAQPQINSNDMPLNGDFILQNTSFAQGAHSPGGAGANVTWDFSNMPDSFESHVVNGDCPGIDICSNFPDADNYSHLAEAAGQTTNDYTFYDATATYFNMVGSHNGSDNINYLATDPETIYKFPISYGETFTDHYSLSDGSGVQKGTKTHTVDGYGTIATPLATYHNVLRYKTERTDTVSTAEFTSVSTSTAYTWIKAGIGLIAAFSDNNLISPTPQPLISVFSYTTITEEPSAVNDIAALTDEIKIYPNPVSNGEIHMSVKNVHVKNILITDMSGRNLWNKNIQSSEENKEFVIPISHWSAGMYLMHITTEKGTATRKINVLQ